jgi:ABC-type sugar transport system permease subunit
VASARVARPPFGLLGPYFAVLAFCWLVPLAIGVRLSFESDALYGPTEFVGARHYAATLGNARFWTALWNTTRQAAGSIALTVPLGLALAVGLRALPTRARSAGSLVLALPALTSPLVLAFLFVLVFAGRHGLLNAMLTTPLGMEPADWLKDPALIPVSLVFQSVWRFTGLVALILAAGLEAAPRAYAEVARAEGAGPLRTFRDAVLPTLWPYLFFSAALLWLDAFTLFSGAYVLLGASGGTSDAGLLLVTLAYQTAFTYGRFGSAAAQSLLAAPVVAGGLFLLLRAWRPRVNP